MIPSAHAPGPKPVAPQAWPADKVERRNVDELVPYARNARTHSAEQVAQLASSIERWGWTTPVLLDESGGIIAGHGRVLAAKKLKLETVPCMVAIGWSDAQKRAYVIADNELALNAGWDEAILRSEFAELRALDFDLSLTGFAAIEIKGFLKPVDPNVEVYSRKLDPPIYAPTGVKPKPTELYDATKTRELQDEIIGAKLPPDVERFLLVAAERHTEFDFHAIAEFYCHASAPLQRLMEKSALVIIDFKSAIENGFVKLTDELRALAFEVDARDESASDV